MRAARAATRRGHARRVRRDPDKIPTCLGAPTTQSARRISRRRRASGVVPFHPPRAARPSRPTATPTRVARADASRRRYCRCRGYERKMQDVPAACVRGLSPPTKPPRLSVAVLSYLPSEVSRLRGPACHYAGLGAVVGVLVQWNGPAPAPLIDCAHVPPDKGDPKFSVDVEVVAFERNTFSTATVSKHPVSRGPAPGRRRPLLAQGTGVLDRPRALPHAVLGLQGRIALQTWRPATRTRTARVGTSWSTSTTCSREKRPSSPRHRRRVRVPFRRRRGGSRRRPPPDVRRHDASLAARRGTPARL